MDEIEQAAQRTAEEAERRARQRADNVAIGTDVAPLLTAEIMRADEMLERCSVVEVGRRIAVAPVDPRSGQRVRVLTLEEFKLAYRHSTTPAPDGPSVSVAAGWLAHRDSKRVDDIMHVIGGPRFIAEAGAAYVNTWTPLERRAKPDNYDAHVAMFLGHVEYLAPVAEERQLLLRWLAHIERCPGVLPHYGILMVTQSFGIGRNWLASVLTRVWRGEVAASLDMEALLGGNFNGRIARTRLAIVDEIHLAESRLNRYKAQNQFRQIVTQEERVINEKYGREYRELNRTRWLMFSNYVDALPLPEGDRRVFVIANPTARRSDAYYIALYAALDDPAFIASIAYYLAHDTTIDLRKFNPGEHPPKNAAKQAVIDATKTDLERDLKELLAAWRGPVASSGDLMRIVGVAKDDPKATGHFGHAMTRLSIGVAARLRIGRGEKERVYRLSDDAPAASDNAALEAAVCAYRREPWFKALVEPEEAFRS